MKWLLALALFAAVGLAQAAPGYYVVVRVDAQGQLTPVHSRRVDHLDVAVTQPRTSGTERSRAAVDASQMLASGAGWTQVVREPERIRGEFAANGRAGRIQSVAVRPQQRSFVLRIPATAGDRITLDHRGRRQVIDLRQLSAQPRLQGAPVARTLKAIAANSANRLDLVVLAEGYTTSEQTKFQSDVAAFQSRMFSTSPYKEYAGYVNLVPLFIASSQSGADHPRYQANCTTTSCCADTASQSDPRAGTFVNTALDGHFCTAQVHRLITVNDAKTYAAADAYPNWDALMVLVNDPVYGGAGGAFATFTTHSSAGLIAIHEFGHSFTGLADEYETPYPGFPACSDAAGSTSPCERNVTNLATAAQVKWSTWFTPGIAIPTPAGTPGTGLFAGARYQSRGMYRPRHTCAMRELGVAFCPICAESYVLKLYTPHAGNRNTPISLVEPGTQSPANSATVVLAAGVSRSFSATILRPAPDSVRLQWYLDGQPISGATTASYSYLPTAGGPSIRKLRLDAWDGSALIASKNAPPRSSSTWTLQIGGQQARAKVRADFNGDGRSDVFWRNSSTGGNDIWLSADSAQRQVTTGAAVPWLVAGLGDFNADGRSDVLWHSPTTGGNVLWFSGVSTTRQLLATEANVAWAVAGIGDFDGDGRADIFWRNTSTGANTIWPAGDGTRAQAASGMPDLNWRVAGVVDFDADGRDDVVWRHQVNGSNELWRSGTSTLRKVLGVQGQAWQVGGLGDFNQDGQADIFWRNAGTGANQIWLSGNVLNVQVATAVDINWKVALVGDFDGDGKADVFWRHPQTGNNVMWRSGLSTQRVALAPMQDVNWGATP